jgi:hypothetical protein
LSLDLATLPTVYGVREAAKLLGMDYSWLSRLCRRSDLYRPDLARTEGGRLVPMWTERRLREILRSPDHADRKPEHPAT